MNRLIKINCQMIKGLLSFIMILNIIHPFDATGQQNLITGNIVAEENNEPVLFATIGLYAHSDSTLLTAAISDLNGHFSLSGPARGSYNIKISAIGYKSLYKTINTLGSNSTNLGTLFLNDSTYIMDEALVTANSIRVKAQNNHTDYLVTKKMADASTTGMDILKLIPGIQMDFRQNISLEGSSDILIFVDGIQRDANYVSQLNPKRMQKVEIITTPLANMDGNIKGAINIILKKDNKSGFNGYMLAEIPSTKKFVYIFPAYNLNYGFKNLNVYASYNGEMDREKLNESLVRDIWTNGEQKTLLSNQYVKQTYGSHRFHFGLDYSLNKKNLINLYTYYNPYSHEQDGRSVTITRGDTVPEWDTYRDETDKNVCYTYSFYYKHKFDSLGREISFDISQFNLKSENRITYTDARNDQQLLQTNLSYPNQQALSIKTDFTSYLGDRWTYSSGFKVMNQTMYDRHLEEFFRHEILFAGYGTLGFQMVKFKAGAGIRFEESKMESNDTDKLFVNGLPYLSVFYSLTKNQNIKLNYSSLINRPDIYQLEPTTSISDPYTINKGNPGLEPELMSKIFLEHTIQFHGNYISSRLFYTKTSSAISNLVFVNDTGAFEIHRFNLGTVYQYGLQLSGTIKFGILTFNPYLQVYQLITSGNDMAKEYRIENRTMPGFETGLSALLSFKRDFALSVLFRYATPKNYILGNAFSDALYMITFEKTFKQKLKVGMVSAIPFKKSMVYQGSEIITPDFISVYKGILQVPVFPVWFRLSYQFSIGSKRESTNRTNDFDNVPQRY